MTQIFDPRLFRAALGSFATGVTIVTTRDGNGRDVGLTANSFNSVSLDPPMVLWSLAKTSANLAAFSATDHFAVHVLAADQQALSDRFAKAGADKFAGVDLRRNDAGCPILGGCAAVFQCRTAYAYEGGDHVIFVGEVVAFEHTDKPPLVFHSGRYALTRSKPSGAYSEGELGESGLGNLITRAFMQLVAPVRRHAEKLGLTPPERHMMNVLLAGGALDLEAVNGIIAYTGVIASTEVAEGLVKRGLVERDGSDGAEIRYRLTEAGREPLIRLLAAAKANEADALGVFSDEEQASLADLLTRLVSGLAARGDENVRRHMDVLKIAFGRAASADSAAE